MKKRAPFLALIPVFICVGIVYYTTSKNRKPQDTGSFATVTDQIGREVKIPKKPERIVSLMPNNTEILFAIGAGPNVVGVSKNCDYPAEAKALPNVAEFKLNGVNLELIVAQKPDLVLASGMWMRPSIDALEQLGIPVLGIDPKSLNDVAVAIDLIGTATGHTEEATTLSTKFRSALDSRRNKPNPTPPSAVYVVSTEQSLMLAGSKTYIGELIELAGGKHVFPELTQEYPKVSDEDVLKRGIDVVFCPNHGGEEVSKQIKQRTGWGRLSAITNNRVHAVNADLISRPGPRLLEGLAELESKLGGRTSR
jgi:iron complex transport system substrate-binding protein